MKWKKAIEFLPDSGKEVFMKIEGTRSTGKYSEHHDLFINESGDFFPADQIEWLDESEQDEGWVSVGDRLPEIGEYVLVFNTEGAILVGKLLHNGWVAMFSDGEKLMGELTAIFWQPLPENPKKIFNPSGGDKK